MISTKGWVVARRTAFFFYEKLLSFNNVKNMAKIDDQKIKEILTWGVEDIIVR